MLPKRPVSLLGSSPPQSNTNTNTSTGTNTSAGAGTHRSTDGDEDELDYVENPFEEARK